MGVGMSTRSYAHIGRPTKLPARDNWTGKRLDIHDRIARKKAEQGSAELYRAIIRYYHRHHPVDAQELRVVTK